MAKREKELMVGELVEHLKRATSLFVTDFRGLSAMDMNELRRKLCKASSNYTVVKNKIARLALERSDLSKVTDLIDGPVGFTFGEEAPEVISKVLVNFAKDHENLKICGALCGGELWPGTYVKEIAALPSRERLLQVLVWGMARPLSGLVGVLAQVLRGPVLALSGLIEKRQKGE